MNPRPPLPPRKPAWLALTVASVALLCSSCGGSDLKPAFPVRGQVLFEGKPVPHALVVFHPQAGEEPLRPSATADAEGRFTLTTYKKEDGAPVGDYAVTVEWRPAPKNDNYEGSPPNKLPARYSKPQSSKLLVRVSEGINELDPLRLTK